MADTETARDRLLRLLTSLTRHTPAGPPEPPSTVYQTSTMAALLDGVYDGDVTVAALLEHGDFGVGTFNGLDGEMVVLDGVCHRLRADGTVTPAADTDRTPFAAVTFFRPDATRHLSAPMTRHDVETVVDELAPSGNLIRAVRVDGHFSSVRTRTVAEQHRPYPPLVEATEGQAVAAFQDIDGTLVGFVTPEYEGGVSVPGYHLHFIDQAKQKGGHCFDFEITAGTVAVATAHEFHLSLPTSPEFLAARPPASFGDQVRRAEGGSDQGG
ncbi:acetolactate decarboxylase [Streptomyces olivaceoviridis]|uniref:acetolactate decarboxylase n=1 Tax=Streptomyces olivaceoviridis TaxID=1921 RepID=UPI00024BC3D3|nr:alpha-acetolactate decarboxylase [Streptomyces hygroscopicus subsp. jinggangensis 5008]AGF61171.1 alpha-acetolactate decarboxylase [Streptomyces hygroscopicus subsp. jinggangensis TL01]